MSTPTSREAAGHAGWRGGEPRRLGGDETKRVIFRAATLDDLEALVDVQQEGGIEGLSHIFAQERYPFPRAEVTRRWAAEIADPATSVYVCTDDTGRITGFAATRGTELLHFGTSVDTWGSGLATELHNRGLHSLPSATGAEQIWLRVFKENHRARRFYEKLGWSQTGHRTRTAFPPNPVLVEYARNVGGAGHPQIDP